MELVKESNAEKFLESNESILLKNESQNNLMLGLADSILYSKRSSESPLFYTLSKDSKIFGQAMRTNPDKPLILAEMDSDTLAFLADELKKENIKLSGAVGPIETAKSFSKIWSESSKVGMHQGIYQLDNVIQPDLEGGSMFLAEEKDFDLVKEFSLGFIKDCFPNDNREDEAEEAAKRNINNKTLYLWKNSDGEIVSMAANNRESKNGATISWVYTPPKYRNHGYGSKIVACLSQKMLDNGKQFCNLFTDLLNPTSNSIYQKIGYKKIGESMHFNF